MEPTENDILKRVRKIEIKTRGLSNEIFAGKYHTAFKGRGMSFAEVREYRIGDDVRDIDWNVTARSRKPHIKVYEEDRELWRKVYRHIIVDNDDIDGLLEDVNIFWNDDRHIIDTFVLKTINRFTKEVDDNYPLLPEFRDGDDLEFARRLILQTMNGADYYRSLISQNTRNWDVERVPLMDRIIMQVALAEITSCPTIPLSVSINEYIEIAKSYSTPNSARYINATLDNISKKLIADRKLTKNA